MVISPLCPKHNMRLRRKYATEGFQCLWTLEEMMADASREARVAGGEASDCAPRSAVTANDMPSERQAAATHSDGVPEPLSLCCVAGCCNGFDRPGGRKYVTRAAGGTTVHGLCDMHYKRLSRDVKDKAQNTFAHRKLRLWTPKELEEDAARQCAFGPSG